MSGNDVKKPQPRVMVNLPAIVLDEQGTETPCTIIDLSKDGFRLKLGTSALTGSEFRLVTDRGTHRIAIRWAAPGEVGGLFLD